MTNPKQHVAAKAIDYVESDMIIGLGTGSTANFFIAALAEMQLKQQIKVDVVSSSVVTTLYARQLGLNPISIEQVSKLDLYVDGADEVSPELTLLKGRGQDLVKEKLLASSAEQFIVLVDETKLVDTIGGRNPVPVEVSPEATMIVLEKLSAFAQSSKIRLNSAGGGWFSAAGNVIIDMSNLQIDTVDLNIALNSMPGVQEHGIFHELASTVLLGKKDNVESIKASPK
jgi:ribose 5-phosphate isomerase A